MRNSPHDGLRDHCGRIHFLGCDAGEDCQCFPATPTPTTERESQSLGKEKNDAQVDLSPRREAYQPLVADCHACRTAPTHLVLRLWKTDLPIVQCCAADRPGHSIDTITDRAVRERLHAIARQAYMVTPFPERAKG